MIKAVIFDFDGTLLDTETPWYEAFRQVFLEQHKIELPLEQYVRCIGTTFASFNPYDYLEQSLSRTIDREKLDLLVRDKYQTLMKDQPLRPGVMDYLQRARERGLGIAIASSSRKPWIERYLSAYGIRHYFDQIASADQAAQVKPDPELYVLALSSLGVSPGEAIAFEDSMNGLKAAIGAGIPCVVVPNPVTSRLPFAGHRLIMNSLTDMTLDEVIAQVGQARTSN